MHPDSARLAFACLLVAAPAGTIDDRALAVLCDMDVDVTRSWRTVAPYVRTYEWVRQFGYWTLHERRRIPVGEAPRWHYTIATGEQILVEFEADDGSWARVAAPSKWGLPTIIGATPREPVAEGDFIPEGFEDEAATV